MVVPATGLSLRSPWAAKDPFHCGLADTFVMSAEVADGESILTAEGTRPDGPGPEGLSLVMIETGRLAEHPGNVRQDLVLSAEFAASVAQCGVRIPLLVTAEKGGGFRVVEGHRRLAAAVKAGLADVPCIVDAGRTADEAGQFLDMLVANGQGYRQCVVTGLDGNAVGSLSASVYDQFS